MMVIFENREKHMQNINIDILSEKDAKEICTWVYDGVYSVYNFSDWDTVVKNNWSLAVKEEREAEFLSLRLDNELIAYGRIFLNEGKAFIGVGLKPSLCGKGYGKLVMDKLIKECKKRYPDMTIALEVRSFNKRALKCYLNVGFVVKDKYSKDTLAGADEFYYMEYEEG